MCNKDESNKSRKRAKHEQEPFTNLTDQVFSVNILLSIPAGAPYHSIVSLAVLMGSKGTYRG